MQPAVRRQVDADLGLEVDFSVQCQHALPDWLISVLFVFVQGIATHRSSDSLLDSVQHLGLHTVGIALAAVDRQHAAVLKNRHDQFRQIAATQIMARIDMPFHTLRSTARGQTQGLSSAPLAPPPHA